MEIREVETRIYSLTQVATSKLPLKGTELLILPLILIYLKWEDWLTLGDCSYYTRSGQEILTGGNPYLGDAKWGSFSAVVMFLFFGWYSQILASGLLLTANLWGIYKFTKLQEISRNSAITISLIIALTSVNRENLVNGQITGLILLAISLGKSLSTSKYHSIVSSALIVFAVEMKPQVAVPLILFLWKKEEFKWIRVLAFTIVAHSIINVYNGHFLEKDFISQILKTSTTNPGKEWENTNNVLPIIDQIIRNDSITKVLGITVVLISCLYMIGKVGEKSIYPLVMTALFMPYIHLYDLLGISIICLRNFFKKRTITGIQIVAIMILLSPLRNLSMENIFLTALVCIVLIHTNTVKIRMIFSPGLLLVFFFVPNILQDFRPGSNVLLNSWITTSVLIALIILNSRSTEAKHSA